jgi:hypothetical protein
MLIARKGQNSREELLRKYFCRIEKPSVVAGLILIFLGLALVVPAISARKSEAPEQTLSFADSPSLFIGAGLAIGGLALILLRQLRYRAQLSECEPKPSPASRRAFPVGSTFRRRVKCHLGSSDPHNPYFNSR